MRCCAMCYRLTLTDCLMWEASLCIITWLRCVRTWSEPQSIDAAVRKAFLQWIDVTENALNECLFTVVCSTYTQTRL